MVKVKIRKFHPGDGPAVIDLWRRCDLVVPWNDPQRDIERKLQDSADLFFVSEMHNRLVATGMVGYDGHRGWIYYLAVDPDFRRQGLAAQLMQHAESALKARGCPKIDLMVRDTNQSAIDFYHRIGYKIDPVCVLSKRLIDDE